MAGKREGAETCFLGNRLFVLFASYSDNSESNEGCEGSTQR
jgi:hypothetical protein